MGFHQRETVSGKPEEDPRATKAAHGSAIIFIFIFITILVLYGSNQRAIGTLGQTGYLIICGMYVAVMKILEESRNEFLDLNNRAGRSAKAEEGLGEFLGIPPNGNSPIHGFDPGQEKTGPIWVCPNGREFKKDFLISAGAQSSLRENSCPDGVASPP